MKIEVIAIGDEILSGYTINSNASYISEKLLKSGFCVNRHIVLEDVSSSLEAGIKESLERSDLVICTGGLGPTCDDITRSAAATIFNSDFYYNEKIAKHLFNRYGNTLKTLKDQATIPTKAKPFINDLGTAAALVFEENGKTLILLPGVPIEMKYLLDTKVIPFVCEKFSKNTCLYREIVHLLQMPEATIDLVIRKLQNKFPTIRFGIYSSLSLVDIHLITESNSENEAKKIFSLVTKEIKKAFSKHIYLSSNGKIEGAISDYLIKNNLTLSLGESCTGGSLARRLTLIPGASKYLLASIVSYSNEAKKNILGVSSSTLKGQGAVSKETVIQMAKGAIKITNSDYSMAISGIAGPDGGSKEKPVGTLWMAISKKNSKTHAFLFNAKGNREMIIERSINRILSEFWLLVHNDPSFTQ